MDFNKLGALANVGNFLVGCVVVYFMWGQRQLQGLVKADALKPPSRTNPLAWVFLAGMILSGYLHWNASRIQISEVPKSESQIPAAGPSPATPEKSSTAKNNPEERIFLGADITPRVLVDMLKGHTEMQGQKIIQDYIGKWMKVSGRFEDVSGNSDVAWVELSKSSFGGVSVLAHFDKRWINRASILRPGERLIISGRISQISPDFIVLWNSEFLDSPAQ